MVVHLVSPPADTRHIRELRQAWQKMRALESMEEDPFMRASYRQQARQFHAQWAALVRARDEEAARERARH